MAIKPVLFNTEMVKAILEGKKTVTRRIIKPQPEGHPVLMGPDSCWPGYFAIQGTEKVICPPIQTGDILWVRETWRIQSAHRFEADAKIEYKSGGPMEKVKFKCRLDYDRFIWNQPVGEGKWKPSIHMPKEVARIFLRVTDVRAERLQSMGHEDAEQEGCWCDEGGLAMPLDKFAEVWDSTIKPAYRPTYGWEANPWAWVIEFERCEKPEGWPC